MLTQKDVWARNEYNADLMRAAHAERLARQAATDRGPGFYCSALSWLGHRMIVWGKRLQEQHGAAIAAPLSRSPGRALSG